MIPLLVITSGAFYFPSFYAYCAGYRYISGITCLSSVVSGLYWIFQNDFLLDTEILVAIFTFINYAIYGLTILPNLTPTVYLITFTKLCCLYKSCLLKNKTWIYWHGLWHLLVAVNQVLIIKELPLRKIQCFE